ncbi:MAG: glycoside hydrolase family 3 N-terminal domain-containing protein [Acidimicrobiales bacterium]
MEGYGRRGARTRRVAVGALAPRRQPREVYRRRRLVVGAVLVLLVGLPWCASRRGGGGEAAGEDPARPTARTCSAATAALPLRSRLAMTLMLGVDGGAPDDVLALLDSPTRPGGVFVRDGKAVWKQKTLAPPLGDDLPLLVAVDDEGGRVQPMDGVLERLASAADLARESEGALESMASDRAGDLGALGINLVLAPVVDVGSAGGIGDRSFGDTAEVVTAKAGAYARGLRAGGVLPVLKHFPGQGHADADTHESVATVPDLALLRTSDLLPYESLLDEDPVGVMVGHLDVPGLTEGGLPASTSAAAIGLLRGGYEFDGLVMTDDLVAMRAITSRFSIPEAAERALAAGADVVLLREPTDVDAVLDRLEEAVNLGRLPNRRLDAALARVVEAGCPA